jgi:hypothetical protein
MMKALITTTLIVFGLQGFAQRNQLIELNNGSQIKGKIIDTNEQQTKIETRDGSVWVFQSNEIAKIGSYVPKVSSTGVYSRASLGILGGENFSPSFQLTNGYSFNSHWDLGMTVGVETVFWDWYVPTLVQGRFNLLDRHFTPFVDVAAGYMAPFRNWDNDKGGFTCGGALGITKFVSNRMGITTSVGYRYARMVELSPWWDDFRTIRQLNRIELRFAITFK